MQPGHTSPWGPALRTSIALMQAASPCPGTETSPWILKDEDVFNMESSGRRKKVELDLRAGIMGFLYPPRH